MSRPDRNSQTEVIFKHVCSRTSVAKPEMSYAATGYARRQTVRPIVVKTKQSPLAIVENFHTIRIRTFEGQSVSPVGFSYARPKVFPGATLSSSDWLRVRSSSSF